MDPGDPAGVRSVVPLLLVSSMTRSLAYYVDGLGFTIEHEWVVDGGIRWCWLTRGGAALMLQEPSGESHEAWKPAGKVGEGVSLWFICDDAVAIWRALRERGVDASEPQVGNGMWATTLADPDGYRLNFESPTDVPEETRLSDLAR